MPVGWFGREAKIFFLGTLVLMAGNGSYEVKSHLPGLKSYFQSFYQVFWMVWVCLTETVLHNYDICFIHSTQMERFRQEYAAYHENN